MVQHRKSIHKHKLQSTYKRSRHGKRAVAESAAVSSDLEGRGEFPHVGAGRGIERPAFLTGRAAAIWDAVVPECQAMHTLRPCDAALLSVWCRLMADFESDPSGMSPAKLSQLRLIGSQFGLAPGARAVMGIAGAPRRLPADPDDEGAAPPADDPELDLDAYLELGKKIRNRRL